MTNWDSIAEIRRISEEKAVVRCHVCTLEPATLPEQTCDIWAVRGNSSYEIGGFCIVRCRSLYQRFQVRKADVMQATRALSSRDHV